jgi:hypothetical protein
MPGQSVSNGTVALSVVTKSRTSAWYVSSSARDPGGGAGSTTSNTPAWWRTGVRVTGARGA